MVKRSSTRMLYVAIAANIAIALSKYAAAALTAVNLRVKELETTIDRLERKIRRQEPEIRRIFIEAESLKRGQ